MEEEPQNSLRIANWCMCMSFVATRQIHQSPPFLCATEKFYVEIKSTDRYLLTVCSINCYSYSFVEWIWALPLRVTKFFQPLNNTTSSRRRSSVDSVSRLAVMWEEQKLSSSDDATPYCSLPRKFDPFFVAQKLPALVELRHITIHYILQYPIKYRSQWLRVLKCGSTASRLLRLRVRILPGYGCLSLVSVVCCQVEVSASGWSLVHRILTDCGVSECGWVCLSVAE